MIKNIVKNILIWETKAALMRHKPRVIGITGSVGKSSAKELIARVLSKRFSVRESPKSYNSEIGLALSVLGLPTYYGNFLGWLKNIFNGFLEIWNKKFPEILVLEMGVDRPKDLDKLLSIARPDIAVVTAIGEIPVHVEFFSGPEEIAHEKSKILKYLSASDHAVLNFDDDVVWSMKEKTKAHIISYGFGEHADFQASNYKITLEGSVFKVDHDGSSVPAHLKKVFGKHNVYPALSAFAVGKIMGLNLIDISEYLSLCEYPPGRTKLLEGIKGSKIIDDSYNSSPLASHAALDTFHELEAKRKIVVFGDMLEIGKYTIEAHKAIGQKVSKIANYLFAVGPRSKFVSQEVIELGMLKENVFNFSTSKEAIQTLKDLIEEGDLILVKGSQGMRMERIVEEIMAHPEDAPKLLVRQDDYWKNKE